MMIGRETPMHSKKTRKFSVVENMREETAVDMLKIQFRFHGVILLS
jgi:hypothetical protein